MRKNPEAAPLEYAQRKKKRILPRALDQILFPWSTVKFFFTVHRTCKESLQVARTRIKNRTPAFNGGAALGANDTIQCCVNSNCWYTRMKCCSCRVFILTLFLLSILRTPSNPCLSFLEQESRMT